MTANAINLITKKVVTGVQTNQSFIPEIVACLLGLSTWDGPNFDPNGTGEGFYRRNAANNAWTFIG
jgi:hypothetical protein